MSSVVRRSSDQTLARVFARRPARRLLVATVVRFIPRRAPENLDGCVLVELVSPPTRRREKRSEPWVFEFSEGSARARRGEVSEPQLSVSVAVPDFVRIAAGQLDPMSLVFDKRIRMKGSFALARRLFALAPGDEAQ
jgi:hypothetical protein